MPDTKALCAKSIKENSNSPNLQVAVFQSLDSTNAWMLQNPVAPGVASLCLAEHQTQGRGRRGNAWQSEHGRNILMSLGWSFNTWPSSLSGLSLMVGMVVAEHLRAHYSLNVMVKWPNDLMLGNNKLGGILIELAGDAGSQCQVVIGLGLNVDQSTVDEDDASYAWTDLKTQGVMPDRNQLVGQIARELIAALQGFELDGFTRLVPLWPEYSSYAGKRIKVGAGNNPVTGIMSGVDEHGALLLLDDHGHTHRFDDSAVHVRLI